MIATNSFSGPSNFRKLIQSILILFIIVFAAVVLCDHALLHRSAKDIAYYCNRNGPDIVLRNPTTGYKAMLCKLPNGLYGRIIQDEKDANLTAFGAEEAARDDLAHALGNIMRGGFTKLEFISPNLVDVVASILAGE